MSSLWHITTFCRILCWFMCVVFQCCYIQVDQVMRGWLLFLEVSLARAACHNRVGRRKRKGRRKEKREQGSSSMEGFHLNVRCLFPEAWIWSFMWAEEQQDETKKTRTRESYKICPETAWIAWTEYVFLIILICWINIRDWICKTYEIATIQSILPTRNALLLSSVFKKFLFIWDFLTV